MNRSLWQNRRFVALSVAQLLASFGTWLLFLAVMVLIAFGWHRGPVAVSLGVVALVAPGLAIHPYAGMVADRWDRKRLMVLSNLLSALSVLSIWVVQDLWQLYVALASVGAIDAFFSPAESGMLKEVVDEPHMAQAMSIRMMIAQGTKIIGPSLSGALVAAFGARIPFAIGGVSFAVSAVVVMFLKGGRAHLRQDTAEPKPRYLDGFRYLASKRSLGLLVAFFGLILFVLQMVDSQFVILVRPLPHASRILGVTMSASGMGMMVVAALIQKRETTRPLVSVSLSSIVVGLSFAGAALLAGARLGWSLPLVVMLGGGGAAFAMIPFQTALQQQTSVDWTGRVQAAVSSISSVAVVVGPILGGFFIQSAGVIPAFLIAAALLLIVGMGGLMVSWKLRGSLHAEGEPAIQKGAPGATDIGG